MLSYKLLIITNRYPANADDGASPFVADFVRAVRRTGIECTVLTPLHEARTYDDDSGVVRFPWGEKHKTIGSLPLYNPLNWSKIVQYVRGGYREAARLHREKNFDFCLALWAAPSGLFARRLKKDFRLPYGVWCLGSDIHTYPKIPVIRNLIVDALKNSDRVFSDGHALGEIARALSGVETHFLPSLHKIERPPYGAPNPQKNHFVCPGRVEPAKGIFDLLEAFRIISGKNKSWLLYYIGDGTARTKLLKQIKKYDLDNRVLCPGFLATEEMVRVMRQARAIVIPTRLDSLPLTFGEAMQLEQPVVVTDVGDLRHFTEKYEVGLVVPPASSDHLAEALEYMINHGDDIKGKYSECVQELDVDQAADSFVKWLAEYMPARQEAQTPASC
jgi:glycosyltransferase involved in cell wall biosynthesis